MADVPSLLVNEIFGPTVSGEGLEVGMPCVFLRLHGCPVKCPGCDTAFSWDGSEHGRSLPVLGPGNIEDADVGSVELALVSLLTNYPGCGLVVSGGEPLLHHRNAAFRDLLNKLVTTKGVGGSAWNSLETSGFLGPKPLLSKTVGAFGLKDYSDLDKFLACFQSVHLSPKITPCLHGTGWSDDDLTTNVPTIIAACKAFNIRLAIKLVVRDEADEAAVLAFIKRFEGEVDVASIMIMPYGQDKEDVARGIERVIPFCAKYGFPISPRLQCLIWGKKRGV